MRQKSKNAVIIKMLLFVITNIKQVAVLFEVQKE